MVLFLPIAYLDETVVRYIKRDFTDQLTNLVVRAYRERLSATLRK